MTAEEIYIKLRDELTAENDSSSSPERIFIKSDGQTICTLGMNRSHEIIFVEFKPSSKDLPLTEKEQFVHPHPVEMLHDAGWRQAQLTTWEDAEKLLEIINRSYKKRKKSPEDMPQRRLGKRGRKPMATAAPGRKETPLPVRKEKKAVPKKEKPAPVKKAAKSAPKPSKKGPVAKKKAPAKVKAKAKPKAKPKPKPKQKQKKKKK